MKTKTIISLLAILMLSVGFFAVPVFAGKGNNVPIGQHYNINIIGVPNEKNDNFNGGQGHRIFVLREGTTWFFVGANTDNNNVIIVDHDATDGFCGWKGSAGLPNGGNGTVGTKGSPGLLLPYDDGVADKWKVDIYMRLLGPVTSQIKWRTYIFEEVGGGLGYYALYDSFTLDRDTKFQMKTGKLLADGYQDLLWEMYDKLNFRILQLRIYMTLEYGGRPLR
jgi:hypothetical protein